MTTKLEAVNDVMRRVGKLPITVLDTGGASTQAHAERAIDDWATKIMKRGWAWNSKDDLEVTPDPGTDKVQVDELEPKTGGGFWDIYHVDTYGPSAFIDVMRVGQFLYDKGKLQDTFEDHSTLKLTYIYERDFTEIPPQFADWIIAEAAYQFNRQFTKDKDVNASLRDEIQTARVEAKREEIRAADVNVLETSEVNNILGRPRIGNRSTF